MAGRVKVEYQDRIVRYPGVTSYSLQSSGRGQFSVIDGRGGRTTASFQVAKDGTVTWLGGDDVETGERVVMAWVAHCLKEGLDPWPK